MINITGKGLRLLGKGCNFVVKKNVILTIGKIGTSLGKRLSTTNRKVDSQGIEILPTTKHMVV